MASIPTDFESLSLEDQILALKVLLDCLCEKVDSHTHPDPIPADPTDHVSFCPGVLGCLDGNGDGKVDVNLIPDAVDLNGFCASVLTCLDMDGDGIIDSSFLPVQNALDLSVIMSFLDADASGTIDESLLPPATLKLTCGEVLDCLDPDNNGIIDAQFLPTPSTQTSLTCEEVLDCLDDDDDGVIDPSFLPVPCVTPANAVIDSTSNANDTLNGTFDLQTLPSFPSNGFAKYALLEVCVTANNGGSSATLTSIASTSDCGGGLTDHPTNIHDGDATEKCYEVWATVENGTDIPYKLITVGGAGLTQSDVTITLKNLFF